MLNLTDREATVLQLRFGVKLEKAGDCQIPECNLDSVYSHTLESVARFLGVTRERVRQLEAKSLRKAREYKPTVSSSSKPKVQLGSLIQANLREVQEISDSGLDVDEEMNRRSKQATENMIARFEDRRNHPEKYWVTGEGGSVKTRSAPMTMYPDTHKGWVLPDALIGPTHEKDTIWEADWDCYCFYVLFHEELNGDISMEVKMHPEQYLDTEVTVFVESTGFQAIVRTSEIGKFAEFDQTVNVDSSMYTYNDDRTPSPTNKTHLQIRINDPDLFDRVGKNYPIEFTALKHKVNSDFSYKSLNEEVGV